jgi:GT2 family glycosyltransferase
LIENDENLGFAKAVNMGLKRSSGEFNLLLNPDTLIRSNSLVPIVVFMKDNAKVGICGCKLLNEDGTLQYSKGSFPTLFSTLSRMVLARRMRKYHLWGYDKIRECDWVTGAFVLTRRSVIKEIGYLDEGYFAYYEEVDYCLRAKKLGWQVVYFPEIKAYHFNPHATSDRSRRIENEIRKSRIYVFRKKNFLFSYYVLLMLT